MSEAPIPCGGCGETESRKRCIGCFHDFGTPDSAWVRKYHVQPAPVAPEVHLSVNPEALAALPEPLVIGIDRCEAAGGATAITILNPSPEMLAYLRAHSSGAKPEPVEVTNAPERLWAWSMNDWAKWGGYARAENRHPLDEKERKTGAEYVRIDLPAPEAEAKVERLQKVLTSVTLHRDHLQRAIFDAAEALDIPKTATVNEGLERVIKAQGILARAKA
jgi:hypothetical protein